MKYLIFLVLILLSFGAFAQDEEPPPDYQLRELTAEEFLAGIPSFYAIASDNADRGVAIELIQAVDAEFLLRYGETATYSELFSAFNQFRPAIMPRNYRSSVPVIDMNAWMARMIEQGLTESSMIDFSATEPFRFGILEMEVTPHDFDMDQKDEWILKVSYATALQRIYFGYLIVDDVAEGYRVVPVSVPLSPEQADWTANEGFQDITGDGRMEWVFTTSDNVPSLGNSRVFTTYYILGWRDDEIVPLYIGLGRPRNIDNDNAQEMVNVETVRDNWGCGTITQSIWDWDGTEYARLPDTLTTLSCAGRDAEIAMWSNDFATAAALYEQFFVEQRDVWTSFMECQTLPGDYICDNEYLRPIYAYMLGRRIIAYALLDNTLEVEQSLAEARPYQRWSEFIRILDDANTTDAETLCRVAYEYFSTYVPSTNIYVPQLLPGAIIPNVRNGRNHAQHFQVDPARAGCDITLFQASPTPTPTTTPTPIPTLPPPTPTPSAQDGIPLADYSEFRRHFRAGDYAAAIQVAQRPGADDERWLYWRALTYEMLDRPDDALKDYVTLYLNYPGSWWGWLAGLHLEPISTDGDATNNTG